MSGPASISLQLARLSAVIVAFAACAACSAATPAAVLGLRDTPVADVVLIGAGHRSGLRQGMACRISRAGAPVAEVVLTEVRADVSSALITSLVSREYVRPGDAVSLKTFKSQT